MRIRKATADGCTEEELDQADAALVKRIWMMRQHAELAMLTFDKLFCDAMLGATDED